MKVEIKDRVTLASLLLILLSGGFDVVWNFYTVFVSLLFVLGHLFYLVHTKKQVLKLPYGFGLFLVFLFILLVSNLWSVDAQKSFAQLILFMCGGGLWLLAYNLGQKQKYLFEPVLLAVGIFFGALFLLNTLLNFYPHASLSLFTTEPVFQNHNYLGDLWALICAVYLLKLVGNKNNKNALKYILIIFAGIFFMAFSFSRSAYVSLTVGIFYILMHKGGVKKNVAFSLALLIFSGIFLILTGTTKSILFSRPYYAQAIYGLFEHPYGVGLGNFLAISSEFSHIPWQNQYLSDSAHNIIFEVVSGVGVFSVLLIYWLLGVLKQIFSKINDRNLTYGLCVIVLLTNFIFTETYFIPTLLFLWFISLGLFQSEAKTTLRSQR